jgi:hypothetical protein
MRKRTENDKTGPFYTIGQFKGIKHETPFLDVYQPKYHQSKMGVFSRLVEKFNKEYDGLVKLAIKKEYDWKKLDIKVSDSKTKEHLRFVKKVLEGKTIRIVNTIKDTDYEKQSRLFTEKLKTEIEKLFTSDKILKKHRELNLKITYKNEKYTTVGGYLTSYNEVIPNVMDEIIINNLKFTILEIDTNRIIKVKLEKIKAA